MGLPLTFGCSVSMEEDNSSSQLQESGLPGQGDLGGSWLSGLPGSHEERLPQPVLLPSSPQVTLCSILVPSFAPP